GDGHVNVRVRTVGRCAGCGVTDYDIDFRHAAGSDGSVHAAACRDEKSGNRKTTDCNYEWKGLRNETTCLSSIVFLQNFTQRTRGPRRANQDRGGGTREAMTQECLFN